MAYTGCNYTSTSFSTICHIVYWFYIQSRMTTAITTFQSASYARCAAVEQQPEPLTHAGTNDNVQTSLVLIFATTIVMVHKITVSSHCRNKNATHRVKSLHSHLHGKEQLTPFQWIQHWFIVIHIKTIGSLSSISKQLVHCHPCQNNWFIVTHTKTIGSLLSISKQSVKNLQQSYSSSPYHY
jgi:hypothetical protein